MNSKSKINILRTDADGFAANTKPATLILEISRTEIESLNYTSSLERLMVMAETRESTLHYRESLLLMITGYDNDRRELAEIPQVRQFMSRLTEEWPHWLWFLSREQGTISLLMSLLCEVKIHRARGQFGIEFTNPKELSDRLVDLLDRGIALFEAFDISPELVNPSAQSALAALRGA